MSLPPLRPFYSDYQLIPLKLEQFRHLTTESLIASLRPGQSGALKTRPDGTILDGHHRLKVLQERGIDIHALPREVIFRREQNENDLLD